MTNEERKLWIRVDEGLYSWWKSKKVPVSQFIREHHEELDKAIQALQKYLGRILKS